MLSELHPNKVASRRAPSGPGSRFRRTALLYSSGRSFPIRPDPKMLPSPTDLRNPVNCKKVVTKCIQQSLAASADGGRRWNAASTNGPLGERALPCGVATCCDRIGGRSKLRPSRRQDGGSPYGRAGARLFPQGRPSGRLVAVLQRDRAVEDGRAGLGIL